MIKIFLYLLIIATVSNADSVVLFSTSFSELPDGWINTGSGDEWYFGSSGAYAYGGTGDDYWDVRMYSPPGMYFVPDGTDSVVVHIEHNLLMSGMSGAVAGIVLKSTTAGNTSIYYETLPAPFGTVHDNQPIHWSSGTFPEGTWIGMSFWAHKETYTGGSNSISWHIYSLTITAYGNEMAMDAATWAAIKNSFQ